MSEDIEFNFPERPRPTPDTSGLLPEPTYDQRAWMKNEVAACGGALVNAICRPTEVSYPAIKTATIRAQTCGCGNDTLVLMPYETMKGEHSEVKLCLICDGGLAWPKLDMLYVPPSSGNEPPPFDGEGDDSL